jgi:hypothetical protein
MQISEAARFMAASIARRAAGRERPRGKSCSPFQRVEELLEDDHPHPIG